MAEVVVRANPATPVQFPPVCICCGAQAYEQRLHKFWYEPTWLIVLTTIMPKLRRFIPGVYNYFEMNPGVCPAHRHRLKWPDYFSWGLLAMLLVFLAILLPAALLQWHGLMMAAIIALPFVVLLVGGANMAVRLTTPRMVQYDHRYVRLASVSPQFADWMGKLEGTATGGTGYANPAGYGTYPQPAARTNPMVFVYAGGGVALMLVLMMCGGVGLVWISSFARDRERAAMQRRAQQVHQDAMDEHRRMVAEMNAQHERAFSRPVSSLPPPPPRQTAASTTTTTPNPAPTPPPPPPREPDSSSAADAADLASNSGFPADPAAFSPEAVIGFPPASGPGSSRPPFPTGTGRSTSTPGFELAAASDVQPGDRIFIQWGSRWFPGKVVETSATQIKVHYDQYDATWDEWAALNRVRAARSVTPGRFSRSPPATAAAAEKENSPASSNPSANSKLRTWSDATGKFKIEAEMVRLDNGQVQLKKADGTTVAVPLDKLSQADQEFAIQQP